MLHVAKKIRMTSKRQMEPTGIFCVAPARVAAGAPFRLKIRVLGAVRKIPCAGSFCDWKPALKSPFNLNVARNIHFHDNCLPEWSGELVVEAGPALSGPKRIVFNGFAQGVFRGDTRPIGVFDGFALNRPGIHFIRLVDRSSGIEGWSNPIQVTAGRPTLNLYWGDPHWQTFFSDGIRCPEELYAFARDEGFLDFGAVSDHMEAITERQWDYFQAVANDFNEPGRFATLIGQEWTHHNPAGGAPGHRNLYFSGDGGPALRSTAPDCDTLSKLWTRLDAIRGQEVLAIPHHPANVVMGADWEQGWNPKYERAVEIHSVWGSSEKHAEDGNRMPIEHCRGERRGRHVVDALKRGFRFGFVGGGDIHDGRPGDPLHTESYLSSTGKFWPSGFTAVYANELTRRAVFAAIRDRRTYATTQSRILLETTFSGASERRRANILAASEEGILKATVVINGEDVCTLGVRDDPRIIDEKELKVTLPPGASAYVRVVTNRNHMAWSSPFWA
jgi:hypothetical protein